MLFLASSMYCKYVIDLLYVNINDRIFRKQNYSELDDVLYESYLKLEKMLDAEFF